MDRREPAVEEVVTPTFWAGKRVFVTGHTGFKGCWLALWLDALGAHVSGYALKPASEPSLWALVGAKSGIASTIADIRDLGALAGAISAFRPEVVFQSRRAVAGSAVVR